MIRQPEAESRAMVRGSAPPVGRQPGRQTVVVASFTLRRRSAGEMPRLPVRPINLERRARFARIEMA